MKIYQAKTIQKIIGIPKHRYDYILMKIRIEPDVEKVIGTGNTNLFSFKKLMEFAIASTAIDIGMSPEVIRFSIESIRKADELWNWHLFEPDVEIKPLSYHVVSNMGALFYCFSGDVHKQATCPTIFKTPDGINFEQTMRPNWNMEMIAKVANFAQGLISDGIKEALGYLTLNLSEIKKTVNARNL